MPEATAEDLVASTLGDALNSEMDLRICFDLLKNAHCLGCWSEAVALYGMEGINTARHRFVFSSETLDFLAICKRK